MWGWRVQLLENREHSYSFGLFVSHNHHFGLFNTYYSVTNPHIVAIILKSKYAYHVRSENMKKISSG